MIEVGRNNIIVRNVDENSKEFKNTRHTFSLYDPVQHKYTFSIYSKEGDDLYFPSSVGVQTIKGLFPNKEVTVNFNNTAKAKVLQYNMKFQPRDDLQKKAIAFLMKMKRDPEVHSRFLSLATGSGKTYTTINVISQFKKKPLIIVDTTDLAEQWKREFLKHTDLKDDDILILSGQDSIDREVKNPEKKVYIAIHRTLGNLMNSDISHLNKLMNKLGIGIRVFDESHVEFGNICRINSFSNVQYTIYLTATPNRSNFLDNSLYAKVFRDIPYFNGKELDAEKYHTIVLYPMDSKPSLDVKLGIRTKYGFSAARWASHIEQDGYEIFLETVVNIIDKFDLIKRQKKTAIMIPKIDLIKKLKTDLEIQYPDSEFGMFIGEVAKKKRDTELSKMFILTNEKICGKGMDIKDLEVLINFVPVGSSVVTEQILGRLRNNEGKSAVMIDVTDRGFDECVKQSKIRKRLYKKKSTVRKIIEIKN